jgi:repressor LexA
MLTRKQHELLIFIHRRLSESGISPSFDEMREALALKSKSGIHRLITGLEERGFIRRLAHKARALDVLRLPDVAAQPSAPSLPTASGGTVITANFGASSAPAQALPAPAEVKPFRQPGMVAMPLLGKIAAGTPIEALSDTGATVDIPPGLISGIGEHYALEVDGDSMIDDGILDGDTVIIQRCEAAENGTIVVALVDEAEATLKHLRKKGRIIELLPANSRYRVQSYSSDRVRVQGRLVGLVRRY